MGRERKGVDRLHGSGDARPYSASEVSVVLPL